MFGYASTSTENLMPMPIWYAHRLAERLAKVRKDGTLPFLRPDGKTQVTVRYENGMPKSVHTVVVAAQHNPDVKYEDLKEAIVEEVIKKTIPANLLVDTQFLVNTTGRFVVGGPLADCGMTGRKIIVDTYGGRGYHGGGAFSGKDPTKVDRTTSYMLRHVAKNVVAAGWPSAVKSRWPTPSACPTRCPSWSILTAPRSSRRTSSWTSSSPPSASSPRP